MTAPPAFSIVVIAHNEAHTLPVLAASLGPVLTAGGEFLVLDTGSDDDTVRVARAAGARIVEAGARFRSALTQAQAAAINGRFCRGGDAPLVEPGQQVFDFGRAREFAGRCASNAFVWHIDASDEVVSADFDFLDAKVRSGGIDAFDYFLELGRGRIRIARFFDRRHYGWRGRVHEAPFPRKGDRPAGRGVLCAEPQLTLRHTRHEKVRNYLAGLALDAIEDPSTPRWQHYLGRELHLEARHRSAIPVLRAHARMTHVWAPERARSFCLLGGSFEALGRPRAASACYIRASRADASRRTPLLRLSGLCQSRSDFQGSVRYASEALLVPQSNPYIDANENGPADPHALLYWGLFWLGRREEARRHWEICCRLDPDNEKFVMDGRLFATRP